MPRKQTTIVKCDRNGCKEIAEVLDSNEAPSNWLLIYTEHEHKYVQRSFAKEFCSEKCVGIWARERAKYLQEQKTENDMIRDIQERNEREEFENHNGSRKAPPDSIKDAIELLNEEGPFSSKDIQDLTGRTKENVNTEIRRLLDRNEISVAIEGAGPNPRKFQLQRMGGGDAN